MEEQRNTWTVTMADGTEHIFHEAGVISVETGLMVIVDKDKDECGEKLNPVGDRAFFAPGTWRSAVKHYV